VLCVRERVEKAQVSGQMAGDSVDVQNVVTETRVERLVRTRAATPRFLQGVFPFAGRGLFDPVTVDDSLDYTVPAGTTTEILYFRAGNWSDDLIYFTIYADSVPIRYFPVAPKGDCHVSLAIVDPHRPGTRLSVVIAAPRNITGTVIVDVGLIEVAEEMASL